MPGTTDFSLSRPQRKTVISLTPLIDVVFILLVFFMLASSFLDWRSIQLSTPVLGDQAAAVPSETARLIEVRATGVVFDGAVLTDAALQERLSDIASTDLDQAFTIRPALDAPVQRLVFVLDQLQAAALTQITLIPGGAR